MSNNIPEPVWLFRMIYYQNLEYVLANGLYTRKHAKFDPQYINIGDSSLIEKRNEFPIKLAGCGNLGDYIPFYFGQLSPMLFNIKTGWKGVTKRSQHEIIYICCTLDSIEACNCFYVFTDGHAKTAITKFYQHKADLDKIDWDIVYKRHWNPIEEDQDRMRRKQAEFLVKDHVPRSCIKRIVTYDQAIAEIVQHQVQQYQLDIEVLVNPRGNFYY